MTSSLVSIDTEAMCTDNDLYFHSVLSNLVPYPYLIPSITSTKRSLVMTRHPASPGTRLYLTSYVSQQSDPSLLMQSDITRRWLRVICSESHSAVNTNRIFITSASGWQINTHRAKRSCSIIVASSPRCCYSVTCGVHAGVSEQAPEPSMSCPVVLRCHLVSAKEELLWVADSGPSCDAGALQQSHRMTPTVRKQLPPTAANDVSNNGGLVVGRGACCAWPGPRTPTPPKPSIASSQPVLFRSSGAASSHNETAVHPIMGLLPRPHFQANEGEMPWQPTSAT